VDSRDDRDDQEMCEWGFMYADDLALVAPCVTKLHEMIQIFDDAMSKGGMELSVSKTKIMVVNEATEPSGDLPMGQRGTIVTVPEFKYLGSVISANGTVTREVEERIRKAGTVFASMRRNIFASKSVDRMVKNRIYSASVLSVLLYGCETWNCTSEDMRRLERFHNSCLRCMWGISRLAHVRVVDLRKLAAETSIASKIMRARLRWLGHVGRMENCRAPKKMLFARHSAPRPRQGPRQRWKDCVQADLKRIGATERWSEEIVDRNGWRRRVWEGSERMDREERERQEEKRRQKETGEFAFRCDKCPRGFLSQRALTAHRNQAHFANFCLSGSESDPEETVRQPCWKCDECGREFRSRIGLFGHMKVHSGDAKKKKKSETVDGDAKVKKDCSVLCPLCNFKCKSPAGLSSHTRHHHPEHATQKNQAVPPDCPVGTIPSTS